MRTRNDFSIVFLPTIETKSLDMAPASYQTKSTAAGVNRRVPKSTTEKPLSAEAHGYQKVPGTPDPLPLEKPPFTLKEIRDSIPAHCFERSLLKSFLFLFHDLAICALLFYGASWIEHSQVPALAKTLLWPLYWFLQGTYMFGLWVLAHECGHGNFSNYSVLDDTVGLFVHTFLLVPYFSWKYSHRKHHTHGGHMEHEEVFVPKTRSYVEPLWYELLEESTLFNLARLIVIGFIALLPLYLIGNFGGPAKNSGKNVNHFSPDCVMLPSNKRHEIILTDVVYFSWIAGLLYICYECGFGNVFFYYGAPQLVCNYHVFVVTLLQHTDTYVPHYRGEDWYWLRGALCAVDRSFGAWLDWIYHSANSTHVCHHLFPRIPHYHAGEATEAIIKVLGKHHMSDDTPILKALWRVYMHCKFVEDEGSILFYKRNPKTSSRGH